MPVLEKVPPLFQPMGRYTTERWEALVKEHKNFLWEEEIRLMDHFMCQQNKGFAWADSERAVLYTPPHNLSRLYLDSLGHSDSPRTLLRLHLDFLE